METCFNYSDREKGFFSSDERKFILKVQKLQEKYPDRVKILRQPEENDGCIYCEMPIEWFTIRVPKSETYTDEQRQKMVERAKAHLVNAQVIKQYRENFDQIAASCIENV